MQGKEGMKRELGGRQEGGRSWLPLAASAQIAPISKTNGARDRTSSPRPDKYFISYNGNCQIDLIVQYVINKISKLDLAFGPLVSFPG